MRRMMLDLIPQKWKQLYHAWDIRVFIVLSLSLQMFLILAAPLRKRTKNNMIITLLWSSYLLADCVANFAAGLILSSQGNPNDNPTGKDDRVAVQNQDLLAFWAPFLLVHLGGPDTITAFAMEDNELWPRHLLGLVFQCVAVVYVFLQSLPQNRLWIPTMLMFFTGVIKYAERTRSLYLASSKIFKESIYRCPDPEPADAKIIQEYISMKKAKLPARIVMVPKPDYAAGRTKRGNLSEMEVVQYAYQLFETFKGLAVDMILITQIQQNQSRNFFLYRTPKDAFKVVETELNFIYDVLFTKNWLLFSSAGVVVIGRFLSFATICSAILLFIFENKTNFRSSDVTITYTLLFGALVLDLIALLMLLFSNWTIIGLRKSPTALLDNKSLKTRIISSFLRLTTEGTLQDTTYHAQSKTSASQTLKCIRRRWSESISTYNLIDYCLHRRPALVNLCLDQLGLIGFMDGFQYVKSQKFTNQLRDFIFEEIKAKSEFADDLETAKAISSARGDWVISIREGWDTLLRYVINVDYDQSIIIWHIATELCYNKELKKESIGARDDLRDIAKVLSDYMLYLLIMQPSLMPVAVVGIGKMRFRDTCVDAMMLFDSGKGREVKQEQNQTQRYWNMDWEQINACMKILQVSPEMPPVIGRGDQSKSLLFDASSLAKTIMEIEEKVPCLNKWLIISKVWVEMLCYGANHSPANTLADQVSKGGELITIVWLLMAHFRLSDQFPITEGQKIAKLIVGK
ncbi:hypothetical protein Lser_V15G04481 [Lactuca serriola]